MELSSWLKNDKESFPLLGLDSFDTFLKVCNEFSEWALDDVGLANRANAYKIWTCKIKPEQIKDVKSILERYTSMKLLLHFYNINIVENNPVALYIKLDFEQNKWMISYGISNNKKLFKVGEFDFDFNTQLPEHQILKYILEEIEDFNPREHLLLYKIKKDASRFNPGYCQILDPQLINKEIIISTYGLGQWNDAGIENGEAEKYSDILKNWVKTQTWWSNVKLIVIPRRNKWLDFKIVIK
jgi:hypothetical protein